LPWGAPKRPFSWAGRRKCVHLMCLTWPRGASQVQARAGPRGRAGACGFFEANARHCVRASVCELTRGGRDYALHHQRLAIPTLAERGGPSPFPLNQSSGMPVAGCRASRPPRVRSHTEGDVDAVAVVVFRAEALFISCLIRPMTHVDVLSLSADAEIVST
jgi:hypothetical protein